MVPGPPRHTQHRDTESCKAEAEDRAVLDGGLLLSRRVGQGHPISEDLGDLWTWVCLPMREAENSLAQSWVARLESTAFWFLVCSSSSLPISGFEPKPNSYSLSPWPLQYGEAALGLESGERWGREGRLRVLLTPWPSVLCGLPGSPYTAFSRCSRASENKWPPTKKLYSRGMFEPLCVCQALF